jgi:hypothetical protein
MWFRLSLILILGGLLSLTGTARAQTFRGGINGTVSDSSGAVISQAKVVATNDATLIAYSTTASGAGEFAFNDLPLGQYKVTVSASSFQTTEVNGVQVSAGNIYTLPVRLNVAQQASTIEVSADSLTLDTTTSTQNTDINGKALQDMPLNGRDFSQLLNQSVAFAGYNNSGSINGTRPGQVNYQIEGSDNNDLYINAYAVNQGGVSGIAATLLPIDAIDDFTLQTAGNSEAGRNPGGVQNLVIKSGTNQLHGSAYYYNRNEALAAETPFAPPGSKKNALRNQNWGASVGGPFWNTLVRATSMDFRTAHEIVARGVKELAGDYDREKMAAAVERILATCTPRYQVDRTLLRTALSARNFVAVRKIAGGPAEEVLNPEIARAQEQCRRDRNWLDAKITRLQDARQQQQLDCSRLFESAS